MTTLTLASSLAVRRQVWGMQTYDQDFTNNDTGASQIQVNGHPRWTCALVSEEMVASPAEAAVWRALILAMRGRVNTLALYDVQCPVPRGTARGVWAAAATAAGASTVVIAAGAGQAGRTLLQGDRIGVLQDGIGRQLLSVQQDATVAVDGTLTVTFEPVLRQALPAGSVVVWDRPTCRMRRSTSETKWEVSGAVQGGFSLDLVESWEP